MSLRFLLIASVLFIPIESSIKCYVITPPQTFTGSVPTGTETECPANTNTCLKTHDKNSNLIGKTCGNVGVNCTNQGFAPNQPAQCYNTTTTSNSLSCCCYGDRCNSTSFTSIFVGLLLALLAISQY